MESSAPAARPSESSPWLIARWKQFRTESPYFQGKVFLVVLYVASVVLTLAVAPPAVDPWICSEGRISFGLSFKTTIELTNVNNGDVDDVIVELHGKAVEFNGARVAGQWKSKPVRLNEGERIRILADTMTDANGVVAPIAIETERVVLQRQGATIAELACMRPTAPK